MHGSLFSCLRYFSRWRWLLSSFCCFFVFFMRLILYLTHTYITHTQQRFHRTPSLWLGTFCLLQLASSLAKNRQKRLAIHSEIEEEARRMMMLSSRQYLRRAATSTHTHTWSRFMSSSHTSSTASLPLVLLEVKDQVATITLNNGSKLNPMTVGRIVNVMCVYRMCVWICIWDKRYNQGKKLHCVVMRSCELCACVY